MAKEKDKKEAKPKQEPKEAPKQKAPSKEARKEKASAAPIEQGPQQPAPPARLAVQYPEKVSPAVLQKFGYKTVMQVPRISKITVNMGVGETTNDKKKLDAAASYMERFACKKPLV